MDFSIVIVNFNTGRLTAACIESIFVNFSESSFEVIVVDNDSADNSVEQLKSKFGNTIIIIGNRSNLGFGVANNLGAKIAKGKYLFFLNSDTVLKKNILVELKNVLQENEIGISAPKLMTASGGEQADACGEFPTLTTGVLKKLGFGQNRPVEKNKIQEVGWVSGAALAISREFFNQLNGFDEHFFMYFEDVDLCKRAARAGYKSAVNNNIELIHLGGKSETKMLKRKIYYYQSQDYFFRKHYGILRMLIMKIFRLPVKLWWQLKDSERN